MQVRCRHIDHVQVCVPPGAEAAARNFYQHVLGFHPVEKPESLRVRATQWFQNGDVEIHVAVDPETKRTKQHPALVVEDIDEVRTHLANNGITLNEEPLIPDRKRFSFLDPWNNRIEFLEYHKDQRAMPSDRPST